MIRRGNTSARRRGLVLSVAAITASAVASLILSPAPARGAVDYLDGYADSTFGQNGGFSSGGIDWTLPWGDAGPGQSASIVQDSMSPVGTYYSFAPYAEYSLEGSNPWLESIRSFTP